MPRVQFALEETSIVFRGELKNSNKGKKKGQGCATCKCVHHLVQGRKRELTLVFGLFTFGLWNKIQDKTSSKLVLAFRGANQVSLVGGQGAKRGIGETGSFAQKERDVGELLGERRGAGLWPQ